MRREDKCAYACGSLGINPCPAQPTPAQDEDPVGTAAAML